MLLKASERSTEVNMRKQLSKTQCYEKELCEPTCGINQKLLHKVKTKMHLSFLFDVSWKEITTALEN